MLVNRVDNNNEFYIKWFMAILISSYFYCLPITRFSFISISTDLRLYDLVFIAGFIILFFPRGGMVLKNKVTPKINSLDAKIDIFRGPRGGKV